MGGSRYVILEPDKYYRADSRTIYTGRLKVTNSAGSILPITDATWTDILNSNNKGSSDGIYNLESDGDSVYLTKNEAGTKYYYSGNQNVSTVQWMETKPDGVHKVNYWWMAVNHPDRQTDNFVKLINAPGEYDRTRIGPFPDRLYESTSFYGIREYNVKFNFDELDISKLKF